MTTLRMAVYFAIALIAVLIGMYYLCSETPSGWRWPINIVELFTRIK